MIIDNNLSAIGKAMFQNKEHWKFVTKEQKEEFFFIFNRYFSKLYPEKAQLLNLKAIDKESSLDLWYYFMLDKPYPNWFWSKTKKSSESIISEKELKLLLQKLKIKKNDLDYLIDNHLDFITEELKYFKEIEKMKNK